jgi:hypothetical protein
MKNPLPAETSRIRIQTLIDRTPAPTRRSRQRILAVLVVVPVLAAAIVVIASELVYGRVAAGLELALQSMVRVVSLLLLLVVMTCVSTWIATRRAVHGLGASGMTLALTALLVVPIYAALVLTSPAHLRQTGVSWVDISPWGARCLLVAGLVGIAFLASLAAALRRAAPAATQLRGAAIGAAAGAWAGLAVFVFCPSGDPHHLLVGHVLPVAAFTVLGTVVVSPLLRP